MLKEANEELQFHLDREHQIRANMKDTERKIVCREKLIIQIEKKLKTTIPKSGPTGKSELVNSAK